MPVANFREASASSQKNRQNTGLIITYRLQIRVLGKWNVKDHQVEVALRANTP
jgi:hypothetical protein